MRSRARDRRARLLFLVGAVLVAGCRSGRAPDGATPPTSSTDAGEPDGGTRVVDADASEVGAGASEVDAGTRDARRVQLFYPTWTPRSLPPNALDLTGVHDLVLFAAPSVFDGGDTGFSDATIASARDVARHAGTDVLLCVGGERSGPLVRARIDRLGPAVAEGVARAVTRHGLDGVVVDIEPLSALADGTLETFLRALRPKVSRLELLVGPTTAEATRAKAVAPLVDRISIMSYMAKTSAEDERAIDAILGPDVGRGIDAWTSADDVARRRGAPRVLLWHAGTLCRRGDAGGLAVCRPDVRAISGARR